MSEEDEDEETFVVVELPPEARLVAGDELRFVDLGTQHPRLRLPSGAELVGRYEESVGDLLGMQPTTTSDDKVRHRRDASHTHTRARARDVGCVVEARVRACVRARVATRVCATRERSTRITHS